MSWWQSVVETEDDNPPQNEIPPQRRKHGGDEVPHGRNAHASRRDEPRQLRRVKGFSCGARAELPPL